MASPQHKPHAAVVPRYTAAVYRRRLHQLTLALYLAALVGVVGMVIGPALNDHAIAAHPARALATVKDVGMLRTTVDFQDSEGIYHTPKHGLLYPSGLGEGQQVWAQYALDDPDLVKVEGRKWTLAIIPAASVGVVATLIAAALWKLISFFTRRAEK
ncbi:MULTISPECIES: DUF3592 domain-containing protein [unclassified Corynebacterium]|uniref:DUF3592 domain-containing protein n=1 Tax=unclassified Corynebacterium TaxID=2624378 RepID=UPI0003B84EA4|nr:MULTISPECIES: DUF3592 domain-containing protein [unclassified Corynebacterium]ERS49282.1 hypothetical protein HMPREF1286_00723 [Corynebacterium sp. KPL1860]ERS53961.1 hypothetical protein HMPREF1264_01568 [Corynebacterium sp. KPL1821]ERS79391.1 hypothetical protein HMPREF1283_00355 [Corynebacterium sp. KPL1857]